MFISQEQWRAFEERYGVPQSARVEFEVDADELDMVRQSRKHGRRHDVTVFALDGDRVVVIRKPFHPPNVYRAPSGGVKPGEPIEVGTRREMHEETGLDVALDRYVLRVEARFACGTEFEEWASHVVTARIVGGRLEPIDVEEIAEARYATLDELQGSIRQALAESGRGLLSYRVHLTDLTVGILRSATPVAERAPIEKAESTGAALPRESS